MIWVLLFVIVVFLIILKSFLGIGGMTLTQFFVGMFRGWNNDDK